MLGVTFDDTEQVKAIKGVKGVQRIVCGGCQDFKVGVYRNSSLIRTPPPSPQDHHRSLGVGLM